MEPPTLVQRFRNLSRPKRFGLIAATYSAIALETVGMLAEEIINLDKFVKLFGYLFVPVLPTTAWVLIVWAEIIDSRTLISWIFILVIQVAFHFTLGYGIARVNNKPIVVLFLWTIVQGLAFSVLNWLFDIPRIF